MRVEHPPSVVNFGVHHVSDVVFFFPIEVRGSAGHSRWMAFELRFYFHNRNEFTEGLRGIWSGGSMQFVCTLKPSKFSQGCRGIGRQFDTDGFFVLEK